jgi:cullin-associated NEDD8-dissociated protein 1
LWEQLAPFVAKALIKNFVTSNPSPRYIQAVASAFKTGQYGRTFSDSYGDLGAAVAAVLLDREARSPVLTTDTTYGKIREPLLRLVHLMRAMEYTSRDNREVALGEQLSLQVGQAVYKSPTVFSFFLPDFAAEGAVEASQLVSPEAQLGVLPNVIGMLDGVSSLVFEGLNSCSGGFGTSCAAAAVNPVPTQTQMGNTGYLSFEPTDFSSAESVVQELDLLLTGTYVLTHYCVYAVD